MMLTIFTIVVNLVDSLVQTGFPFTRLKLNIEWPNSLAISSNIIPSPCLLSKRWTKEQDTLMIASPMIVEDLGANIYFKRFLIYWHMDCYIVKFLIIAESLVGLPFQLRTVLELSPT